jgi:hypothetical protein
VGGRRSVSSSRPAAGVGMGNPGGTHADQRWRRVGGKDGKMKCPCANSVDAMQKTTTRDQKSVHMEHSALRRDICSGRDLHVVPRAGGYYPIPGRMRYLLEML